VVSRGESAHFFSWFSGCLCRRLSSLVTREHRQLRMPTVRLEATDGSLGLSRLVHVSLAVGSRDGIGGAKFRELRVEGPRDNIGG
jgi:putative hemolysin